MNPCGSILLTDLYELTMVHSYWARRMTETAVFEFFVRRLPRTRNFLIAAGLEQALQYLETLHFEPEELEWIAHSGRFEPGFSDYLSHFRFEGDVDAMPEGTVFFPNEPILRVVAPIAQAQIVETRLINLLQFQTMVASKAARFVLAARGKSLVDFGLRRAHGWEAGLLAARAAYMAGFAGTSATIAGPAFGIPVFGTMAHSFVQAFPEEYDAFAAYANTNPGDAMLLIDTYDTEAGAEKAARLARRLRIGGIHIKGVRLDSGDLAEHSRRVRSILDREDCGSLSIFASGNLDEYCVDRLVSGEAPIDGFGVGTALVTSSDAPNLDCVYKLQEYAGRPTRKRSEGKATWPGRKQVFRRSVGGVDTEDTLTVQGDGQYGEALLVPVMRSGRRINAAPTLEASRRNASAQVNRLPSDIKNINRTAPYHVAIAPALKNLAAEVDRQTAAGVLSVLSSSA